MSSKEQAPAFRVGDHVVIERVADGKMVVVAKVARVCSQDYLTETPYDQKGPNDMWRRRWRLSPPHTECGIPRELKATSVPCDSGASSISRVAVSPEATMTMCVAPDRAGTCLAWRWDHGAPIPDADVVVCAPDMLTLGSYRQFVDMANHGRMAVVPALTPRHTFGVGAENAVLADWLVPALYVQWNSDLVRFPDLVAVRAEHRAVVVDPAEPLNMHAVLCKHAPSRSEHRYGPWCSPASVVDFVLVAGFSGRLNPEYADSVVWQCQEAGMQVIVVDGAEGSG